MDTHQILTAQEAQELPGAVLGILQRHQGARNSITGRRIAHSLGHRNDRKVRVVIQQLIAGGHPIAASVAPPYGYYVISTREEGESYMAVLKSRATHTFERMRDFGRALETNFGVPFQPFLPTIDQGTGETNEPATTTTF